MKKDVALLALCQALFVTSTSFLIATSALVGLTLAPDAKLSTVPLGLQFVATMATTMPASLLMSRIGRCAGLRVGVIAGMLGGGLGCYAIVTSSFEYFCAACALLGVFNSFGQYFRFAAADVATPEFRSRAISYALSGGVLAAFAGPNLAKASSDWMLPHMFAGGYAALIGLYVCCFIVLGFVNLPKPVKRTSDLPSRPLSVLAGQGTFIVSAFCATVAYGTMNLIMTATPLAMRGCGFAFGQAADVIQWHVVAMFAPAFWTGGFIARWGALNVMFVGALTMLVCVAVNLSGIAFANFWTGLVLLGLGWNFLFVGATSLLTSTYTEGEKAKVQGLNEFLVFGMVAVSASTAGALQAVLGWSNLNLCVIPFILGALCAIVWLKQNQRGQQAGLSVA